MPTHLIQPTNGNIYRVSKEERKTVGFNEEEKQTTPPPWGWSPAQKKNAHGVKEIVYDRSWLFPVIREKKRLKPQPRIAQALDFRR